MTAGSASLSLEIEIGYDSTVEIQPPVVSLAPIAADRLRVDLLKAGGKLWDA